MENLKASDQAGTLLLTEAYWAQELFKYDLGPQVHGLTLMEVELPTTPVRKLTVLAFVSSFIEGTTYKIEDGTGKVSPLIKAEHQAIFEKTNQKFKQFTYDYNLIPLDVQFMIDKQNRGWVIDPGGFPFPQK